MATNGLLRLEDINVDIENVPVLRDVSLNIDTGETVALVGRNGAGKTTTFRSIMGLERVLDGRVMLDGEDLTETRARDRSSKGLGFMPEDRRLFTDMTVEENLQISAWGAKGDVSAQEFEEIVERAIQTFPDMDGFIDRKAGKLSGGQQKMVAVSRALAADPKVLLLDEPFEGLAPVVRETFREGIERIMDQGVSILFAESNVQHAQEVAERFYVIERGEIQTEIGSSDAVMSNDTVQQIFGV